MIIMLVNHTSMCANQPRNGSPKLADEQHNRGTCNRIVTIGARVEETIATPVS